MEPPDRPDAPSRVSRRQFLQRSAGMAVAGALAPLLMLGKRAALGLTPTTVGGYGPLVNKGDLWLPEEFEYQIISRQGHLMSDGNPTPGIFDGMGAFSHPRAPGHPPRTILIRNHENRELAGELRVLTDSSLEYDPQAWGGNTKLVVERRRLTPDPATGKPRWEYSVTRDFAVLGGTTTNCAGGELPYRKWITCEEVVKRSPNGQKHGYIFEIDATAEQPVPAVPVVDAGRFAHEAVAWRSGILYLTEDRSIVADPLLGATGACFYRYLPERRLTRDANLAFSRGKLQALRLRTEFHANMNTGRVLGQWLPISWVNVDAPDHDDDTDSRTDRVPGFTPTRIQAQDRGAAYFERIEGIWAVGGGRNARLYFACTSGGAAGLGQIWELHPGREAIRLLFESTSVETLKNPDNVVVVPRTRDVFLCEDSFGPQFIRGLTRWGEIYNFARSGINHTEFCGACFDPAGQTLFVNQQGNRGNLPNGTPGSEARTYAIYGPFRRRTRHGATPQTFPPPVA